MSTKPFASSADLAPKHEVLEHLADGVVALTAEGDPNVGAIATSEGLVCVEARATPVAARRWLERLHGVLDGPVSYLVLSHYHAVRVLGASAFDAGAIVAHTATAELIEERGAEDWASEQARMPRLFEEPASIPGLTRPTLTFADELRLGRGGGRGDIWLWWLGRGHTRGDIVVWLPRERVLFAGDLVEARAALYTGDAYHREWSGPTLDAIADLGAEVLVGGRGAVVRGREAVAAAIAQSRRFLQVLIDESSRALDAGGGLREAFGACYEALAPTYGSWPIFEHTIPFDVARVVEELQGVEHPTIWTTERDRAVWDELQGSR
ncbi:beta-lactamase domain protein [Acidimicrobium ferrooxidans DSM 10331]|uniref:Beta-lactamase domain protein n=1 Tax=Acidimicrobium ferrooxidans (strain DSM 10331 / JCM 15462 / NBRC 103882 / ICP) TaxID=525909 RepID=C7LYF1_ACIFD|nr:MBL fold metallo-hydrolase [Acidimicrobium ferrooxidans]ACU53759.1 beta-lactamase domain protein [Acidimicrobium ferrooxidans DSM 10331]